MHMKSDFEIKQFLEKDWKIYKKIRLESLESDPQAFGSNLARELAFKDEKWKSRLKPFSKDSKSITLGVFEKSTNVCIGTIGSYSPSEGVVMIVGVYISPKYRGKGLSTLMLKELLKIIADKKEFTKVELSVNIDQVSAVSLYKNCGFNITREEKVVLGDGIEHTEYAMELVLN